MKILFALTPVCLIASLVAMTEAAYGWMWLASLAAGMPFMFIQIQKTGDPDKDFRGSFDGLGSSIFLTLFVMLLRYFNWKITANIFGTMAVLTICILGMALSQTARKQFFAWGGPYIMGWLGLVLSLLFVLAVTHEADMVLAKLLRFAAGVPLLYGFSALIVIIFMMLIGITNKFRGQEFWQDNIEVGQAYKTAPVTAKIFTVWFILCLAAGCWQIWAGEYINALLWGLLGGCASGLAIFTIGVVTMRREI